MPIIFSIFQITENNWHIISFYLVLEFILNVLIFWINYTYNLLNISADA